MYHITLTNFYLAFVPARKPPVAVLLHNQGYQHQAISTANTTNTPDPASYPQPPVQSGAPAASSHSHSHTVPVQNVHVQNIQAQNIQVQNVLVQPSAALEQTITGHNVQLQSVQSGSYLHPTAPYTNVQIQNIGPQVQQNKVENVEDIKIKTDINEQKTADIPKCPKSEPISFLTPVSNFQIVTSVTTTSFTTPATSHNYIMTYSNLPAKNENQTSVIIAPEIVGGGTVLVSQPMLVNLEQAPHGEQPQFGGYVPVIYSSSVCCSTQSNMNQTHLSLTQQKDSSEAKQARTPLVPTQHTHSPQLPAPSPNYPIQSQIIPDNDKNDRIPNRNVPILNNNYINSSTHHPDITSQNKIGEKLTCLKTEKIEGNSGVVNSDSKTNELFNQVANLNNVNNDSRICNEKIMCTQAYTNDKIHNGPQTVIKDSQCNSDISTSQKIKPVNQLMNITFPSNQITNVTFSANPITDVTFPVNQMQSVIVSSSQVTATTSSPTTCITFPNNQITNISFPITTSVTTNPITTVTPTNQVTSVTPTNQITTITSTNQVINITPSTNQLTLTPTNQVKVISPINQFTNLTPVVPSVITSVVSPLVAPSVTSACVETQADKAQSFTVLNVPTINRYKLNPENERQPVSKLDMMTARRREKRMKRHKLRQLRPVVRHVFEDSDSSVYTSSDSECEEICKVDLWIKSGPPLKPNYKPEKLSFLKIFGLTTYQDKNGKSLFCFELKKFTVHKNIY